MVESSAAASSRLVELKELEVGEVSLGSSEQPEDRDHSPLDWQVTVVAEPV